MNINPLIKWKNAVPFVESFMKPIHGSIQNRAPWVFFYSRSKGDPHLNSPFNIPQCFYCPLLSELQVDSKFTIRSIGLAYESLGYGYLNDLKLRTKGNHVGKWQSLRNNSEALRGVFLLLLLGARLTVISMRKKGERLGGRLPGISYCRLR